LKNKSQLNQIKINSPIYLFKNVYSEKPLSSNFSRRMEPFDTKLDNFG
jgi:hypothetical protein